MTMPVSFLGLSNETVFKKGDFNKITSLYTMMLSHNIARDCAPVIRDKFLAFRIYKSAHDPMHLYEISIERDERNNRYIYEVKTAAGQQIARDSRLDTVLKKFKYYMGDTHHITEWKRPKRRTDEKDDSLFS